MKYLSVAWYQRPFFGYKIFRICLGDFKKLRPEIVVYRCVRIYYFYYYNKQKNSDNKKGNILHAKIRIGKVFKKTRKPRDT